MGIARAIDVGYGNTKTTTASRGGEVKCKLFPSMSNWRTVDQVKAVIGEKRDTVAGLVNEMFHEVGPSIAATEGYHRATHMHDGFVDTPEYRAFVMGALHYMNKDTIDLPVLGLPVQHLVALQHEAWTSVLIVTHVASEWIGRTACQGTRQRGESRERVLADYANYFGERVGERFAPFVAEPARGAGEKGAPAQRELFEAWAVGDRR